MDLRGREWILVPIRSEWTGILDLPSLDFWDYPLFWCEYISGTLPSSGRFPLPAIGGDEYTPGAHPVADLLSRVAESGIGNVGVVSNIVYKVGYSWTYSCTVFT